MQSSISLCFCVGFTIACKFFCGQDSFKKQVEHIQKQSRRNKLHVEKGWYTKAAMKTELKWSPSEPKLFIKSESTTYISNIFICILCCTHISFYPTHPSLSQVTYQSCGCLLYPSIPGQDPCQAGPTRPLTNLHEFVAMFELFDVFAFNQA